MSGTFLIILLLLSVATVDSAVTFSTSIPVKRGGFIISGRAKTIPHSGSSAAVATEKAGYQPIELNIKPVTTPARGLIRLEYYPYFSSLGARTILTSGKVAVTAGCNGVILKIGENIFEGKCLLQPRVWYAIELRWLNGQVTLTVDDHPVVTLKRATLPIAQSVSFGGMPDGLLRRMLADNPTVAPLVTASDGGEALKVNVVANNLNYASFDYFDNGKARILRVRPALKISPGDRFVVEQSGSEPLYVTAETAGELTLKLPGTWSSRVDICRDPGNLLSDASFEAKPGTWQTTFDSTRVSAPKFGFTPPLTEPPLVAASSLSDSVEIVDAPVRDRKKALEINKKNQDSIITVKSTQVTLKSGTRYLFGAYHRVTERPQWGGSFFVRITLRENGKVKRVFNEYSTCSPLRQTDDWRYIPLSFVTPSGNTPLAAEVELISDGAPCRIVVDDLSLREYPRLVFNPMPENLNKKRLLTGKKLIEHLGKRPPVKLPSAPLSGVAGYGLDCYNYMNRAGIDILWCKVNNGRQEVPAWKADGTYDFSSIDESILNVLSYAPDAVVGLYFRIDPALDFGERYPDAAWCGSDGKVVYVPQPDSRYYPERKGKKYPYVSYTAEDFRREAGKFLHACGEHLKQKPWGKSIGAIHLIGGGDGQWFYRPRKNDFDDLIDRSPGNLAVMRQKLREYYQNNLTAFRKAWGDDKLTFDTVEFPPALLWRKYPRFRDPDDPDARKLIDISVLYPEAINDSIGSLAAEFEKGLGHQVLKSRYYYGTALGHALNSPDFDGVVSVSPYGVSRLHGVAGRLHQAAAPATLRNKFFLTELDLRTSYSSFPVRGGHCDRNWLGVEKGPENFGHIMRKMAAPSLISGQGLWYLMIGGNPSYQGKFERYLKESADAVHSARKAAIDVDGSTTVFCDEKARTVLGPSFGNAIDSQSQHKPQEQWFQSGLGIKTLLLEDLTNPKRRPTKLNIFPLASTITEEQIRYVETNLQKNGNVLVFAFDAGRTAPGGFERNIKRLTGMTVRYRADAKVLTKLGSERFSDPLSKHIGMPTFPSVSNFMIPLFYVDDPAAKPLALLAGTKLVGAAVKRHKNWTGVYFSVPVGFALSPTMVRALAAEAGVKPIGPAGDCIYAGDGFLVVHANTSGVKTFNWDIPANVLDITSNRIISYAAKKLEIETKVGETRWFRLLKAQGVTK